MQSLPGRDVQPGVAAQVFSWKKRTVRGRAPGKRADPAGVAHTGSTALMPGQSKLVLTHFILFTFMFLIISGQFTQR